MRYCNGCTECDGRKNPPCKKGLPAYKSEKSGQIVRPSKCKKKYRQAKEINYKEKAVDAFQMYIRYRDNWTCCCCGKYIDPSSEHAKKEMHAGHYISRAKLSLLLDEKNVHAQCRECNGKQNWEGIDPRYTQYIINKYGIDILDYLSTKKREIVKIDKTEWENLFHFWEQKLNEIKNQRR
ncbi:MAG: recombination protein NinG [Alphaproteobacteria bacterium]|nr:recombination protein NinG [Alphaproteobacteria bacterium]